MRDTDAVGLTSISSVGYQLSALERKGYLTRDGRRPRTTDLRLPSLAVPPEQGPAAEAEQPGNGPDSTSREPVYVPVVSRIVHDGPILADEQIEDVFPLPRRLVGDGIAFALRMAGDSMISAAIADGDWVVVRQQESAEDGAIVAVLIGNGPNLGLHRPSTQIRRWANVSLASIRHRPPDSRRSGLALYLAGMPEAVCRGLCPRA